MIINALIALDCLFADKKTIMKEASSDIVKVMGSTMDNAGMKAIKQTDGDLQQQFYNSMPLQFLYIHACDEAGDINLNTVIITRQLVFPKHHTLC